MIETEASEEVGLLESREPKLLAYDIECTGILGYGYGIWETNIHKVVEQPILLSFSYAWYEGVDMEPKIKCRTLADMSTYESNPKDDYKLVVELWELFNETDVTIGHNSRAFDDKVANMFFLKHGLTPPAPHQQLDTKLMAKQVARFPSNSLNNLSEFFDIGKKTETTHADLWWASINGGKEGRKAMKKMAIYNIQDVNMTIKLYEILKPWYRTSVNLARVANVTMACPSCLGYNYHQEGTRATKTGRYHRYQCNDCFHWFSDRSAIRESDTKPNFVST
jgi:hypothetical protein